MTDRLVAHFVDVRPLAPPRPPPPEPAGLPWPGGLDDQVPDWPPLHPERPADEAEHGPPLRRRTSDALVAWLSRHRLSLLVLTPVLTVVGLVHAVGMSGYPIPVDDEGTYMAEAWSVQMHQTLAPYTYWYDHPPLGWIQIAGWTWLTDGFRASQLSVASGRELMLLAFLVSAGLVFVIARRLGMSRVWAAVGVLALGLSPISVLYERMVYLDNLGVMWVLAAFALALTPTRKLWAFAGSGACFAMAVLSKETLLIFGPALLWQAWQRADRRTRAFCVTAQAAVFLLLVVGYPLYALLRGELVPGKGHVSLASAINFQLSGRESSGTPLSASSPAHSQVVIWLHADPWLLGAGTVCMVAAFAVGRLRPIAGAYLIGLVVLLRGGYLPVPYVLAMLPFAALLVAGVGDALWQQPARRRLRSPRDRLWRGARRISVLVAGVLFLGLAAPAWASSDVHAMTTNESHSLVQTETWIEAHIPRQERLMVDDSMWVDMVDHGFHGRLGVVWFYKFGSVNNLDPSVARALPAGWRDFQYIVDSPSIRAALSISPGQLNEVRSALAHSDVVATFGQNQDLFQVRRIVVPSGRNRVPVR